MQRRRFSGLLNDKVKAKLVDHQFSYVSSGSDHSATDDSPCLSELVHDFLEHDLNDHQSCYDSDTDGHDSALDRRPTENVEEIITKVTANGNVDLYKNFLAYHVSKGIELFSSMRLEKSVLRRKVMIYLRDLGLNAAICKTRWNSSGGLNSGSYEFIDVVQATTEIRYFIELDLASEFEIARPTSEYKIITELLPRLFVGKSDELKKLVKATSEAARKSLKMRGLTLPPWRKNRYMQNKWFAPYKRTVNPTGSVAPVLSSVKINMGVNCRSVGFDGGVNGCFYVRTR